MYFTMLDLFLSSLGVGGTQPHYTIPHTTSKRGPLGRGGGERAASIIIFCGGNNSEKADPKWGSKGRDSVFKNIGFDFVIELTTRMVPKRASLELFSFSSKISLK